MNNFGMYSAGASPRPTNKDVMLAHITVERTMLALKTFTFESFLNYSMPSGAYA